MGQLRAGHTSWGIRFFVGMLSCFAPPGPVRVVVERQGGPWAPPPCVASLLRFVVDYDCLPFCVLLVFCVSFDSILSSGGFIVVWSFRLSTTVS